MIQRRIHPLFFHEDWWAVWLGGLLIAAATTGLVSEVPGIGQWTTSPGEAFGLERVGGLVALGGILLILTTVAVRTMGGTATYQMAGFVPLFILAVTAYTVAQQVTIRTSGFGYPFWALVLGLLIANTVGTPRWIKSAMRSELYVKTGLVLLGAEILFGNVLTLGIPGIFVAWVVTPTVMICMYQFGTRWLRMKSRSLVMVIAAATSVCGISAAIAAAAAVRARKEELTLAVGMSIIFTVLMMVFMPLGIRASGMDPIVGAAWIGGTIDATGAVVAAGALLGEQAEQIAAIVKMIQNILIGLVAFLIAVYWVTTVETTQSDERPKASEIWHRFPKFIIGFITASLVFSFVLVPTLGTGRVEDVLSRTSDLRGWLFCLAFVSIGLSASFRELGKHASRGHPFQLYLAGQTLNLVLTLLAAYLAFGGVLFKRVPTSPTENRTNNVIRHNLYHDHNATALFYTEVPGWSQWTDKKP